LHKSLNHCCLYFKNLLIVLVCENGFLHVDDVIRHAFQFANNIHVVDSDRIIVLVGGNGLHIGVLEFVAKVQGLGVIDIYELVLTGTEAYFLSLLQNMNTVAGVDTFNEGSCIVPFLRRVVEDQINARLIKCYRI